MQQALAISRYAFGRTSPNPMVGAVIVREGRIVAQGWHRQAGTPHAEIHALQQAGELASGATMYVTLEPCSHYGRTGPCAEAVIRAGIKRVVVAMTDPNPLVSGKGINRLRQAGLEVVQGVMAKEAAKLNEVFIKWIATEMPFVALKTAMSLDGKIAAYTGHSQWVTGEKARECVHRLRDEYDAILTGTGTLLSDNPRLTVRLPGGGKNPLRIVVDSTGRIPLTSNVISDGQAPTLIAVTSRAPQEKLSALRAAGVEVLVLDSKEERVDLRQLLAALAKRKISSVLVEGGATLNAALLTEGLVDKLYWFIAPKIVGGVAALGPVGGRGIEEMSQALLLEDICVEPVGDDFLFSAYVKNREGYDVYRACGRTG
jgi:diaminohydroxyphosphoribosylaminopyrimidine deaminase/5-amino-6-(5-phosphoribosylamino)uracil reductase